MHFRQVFLILASLCPAYGALAQSKAARCPASNVIVVDRYENHSTITLALAAMQPELNGRPMPYREGSDVQAFARRVAASRPKLVVVHYSTFGPRRDNRFEPLEEFVRILEANNPKPMRFVVYSALFAPENRPLERLRGAGLFRSLNEKRLKLIHVGRGVRFRKGNGDTALRRTALELVRDGLCAR